MRIRPPSSFNPLRLLRLLLPVLVPSWRFFDVIAASPRIDYGWSDAVSVEPVHWHPFCPPPAVLGFGQQLCGLVWNPNRNAALYLVSCGDRVVHGGDAFALAEIRSALLRAAGQGELVKDGLQLHLRIRSVERQDTAMMEEVVYREALVTDLPGSAT